MFKIRGSLGAVTKMSDPGIYHGTEIGFMDTKLAIIGLFSIGMDAHTEIRVIIGSTTHVIDSGDTSDRHIILPVPDQSIKIQLVALTADQETSGGLSYWIA